MICFFFSPQPVKSTVLASMTIASTIRVILCKAFFIFAPFRRVAAVHFVGSFCEFLNKKYKKFGIKNAK